MLISAPLLQKEYKVEKWDWDQKGGTYESRNLVLCYLKASRTDSAIDLMSY